MVIKFIFCKILGWSINGKNNFTDKCIIIVAPHTHWLDFFLGITVRHILKIRIHFIGKKELFFFPLNFFLKYMGGIPVTRNSNTNTVESVAQIFRKKKKFRLALSPEGTRKKVVKWKTGFYYIAKKASVPIISVSLNIPKKQVNISEPFYPTSDIEKDIKSIKKNFEGAIGIIAKFS
ncbi:MAG: 1-acyl-sn-glycerol-3-phosphate acyltransferase [Bacteroidota bacterium]|nr:1-acyl-sn-glycerol-3-phosphate acyltransferase [Bacteroidota bacterium]